MRNENYRPIITWNDSKQHADKCDCARRVQMAGEVATPKRNVIYLVIILPVHCQGDWIIFKVTGRSLSCLSGFV